MRLHSLSVTAFGPFAEATTVDFDALSEASVFLLCGDTGAGKSTVLDAVCFALYGDVPSDRARAKQLRSHFAADGVAPEVVLETTLAGRRLRFTRSPAWARPKRRGSGTTTEQAHVLVQEHVAGEWVLRTNRLDEAGHLVDAVLGMTKEQFSQVVLLPQGQFDTFLAAPSEDRQRVLTQLFRTRRFEDVERWLVEHRTGLRREADEHRREVGALLHRLAEVAGADLPEDLGTGPDDAVSAEHTSAWAAALAADAERALGSARSDDERSTQVRLAAEQAVADADERLRLRMRHDEAREVLAGLADSADRAEADRVRLEAGRRAARVVPLLAPVLRAERAATAAEEAAWAALAALGRQWGESGGPAAGSPGSGDPLVEGPSVEALEHGAAEARDRAGRVSALLPRADELARLTDEVVRLERLLEEAGHEADEVERALADQPAAVGAAQERQTSLREAAGAGEAAERRAGELRERRRVRGALAEASEALLEAREQREALRQRRHEARESLHAVQELRLRSIAAELAADLAVGAECPVCGSGEHPSPARPAPGSVGADDERAARHLLDGAEVDLDAADESVRVVETRVASLAARVGDSRPEDDAADLQLAVEALDAARAAAAELPDAERALAAATARQTSLQTRRAELAVTTDALVERCADVTARADRITEELRSLREDTDAVGASPTADDLRAVVRGHESHARALTAAASTLARREHARAVAADAAAELADAAAGAGFTSAGEASDAALSEDACLRLERDLGRRETQQAEARSALTDPDVLAAAEQPVPDLAGLRLALTEATSAATGAATRVARARERCHSVEQRRTELDAALGRWAPVRDDLEVARSLAELAEGKGSDNTRQMRLSAYVLAARLGQVVAAANERLARMSDDRYLLEHVADRAVGDRRGGLSLLVRDQWTDETRDPVTLSGGETFVVSLALALGLADVVTGEAGGARIDTLFVDEGFGSLDPDTLELVMDTLDELREGGRVVGVVSHVPELRTRIGTQLVVRKGRHGSALELRHGAA